VGGTGVETPLDVGGAGGSVGEASPLEPPEMTRVQSMKTQASTSTPTSMAWTAGFSLICSLIALRPR
jgi:hypothetical protein